MSKLTLFNPQYAGLSFGPDRETGIQFGNRAGQADHFAEVDVDDPLLQQLLEQFPETIVVQPNDGPSQVYPDPFGDHEPFKTEAGWVAHMAEVHGIDGKSTTTATTEHVPAAPEATEPAATPPPAPAPSKPASAPRRPSTRRSRTRRAKPSPRTSGDA